MGMYYGQLSQDERLEIYHYRRLGWSVRRVAAHLDRAPSTVSREVARNGRRQAKWSGGYDPVRAHRLAARRRQVDKSRFRLVRQPDLLQHVVGHLAMGWSPQQISGRLARQQGGCVVSHESIYRYIYYCREQKDYLCRLLPQARSRRRPRRKRSRLDARIPHRTSIHDRPAHIEARRQPGHWEADMMQFSQPGW